MLDRAETGLSVLVAVLLRLCDGSGPPVVQPPGTNDPDDAPQLIVWPDDVHPTLQSAIDALADDGVLRIRPGEYELDQPLTITRRLAIEGAGACDMTRPVPPAVEAWQRVLGANASIADGESAASAGASPPRTAAVEPPRTRRQTTLTGPAPAGLVPADDAVGVFSFVGLNAGGSVERINLRGFDTGILTKESAALPGSDGPLAGDADPGAGDDTDEADVGATPVLDVDQVCISETGRGVTSLGSITLSMSNSGIRNTLGNGVTLAPRFTRPGSLTAYTFWGMQIHQTGGWCMYAKGGLVAAHRSWFINCDAGGAYVEDGGLSIDDSVFVNLGGPGIGTLRSGAYVENNSIFGATVAGVLLHSAGSATLLANDIDQTAAVAGSPIDLYGDGIIAVTSPLVVVEDNHISNSSRSAVAAYGSTADLARNDMRCQSIDLIAEDFGSVATVNDLGGNLCGCPTNADPMGDCDRAGAAEPPPSVGGLE